MTFGWLGGGSIAASRGGMAVCEAATAERRGRAVVGGSTVARATSRRHGIRAVSSGASGKKQHGAMEREREISVETEHRIDYVEAKSSVSFSFCPVTR